MKCCCFIVSWFNMEMKKEAAPEVKREQNIRILLRKIEMTKKREGKELQPCFLYTETWTQLPAFSSLISLSSLPSALLPLSSPLLVTTATGGGQKTKGEEKCVDERLRQLKNIEFVLWRGADLLFGAWVPSDVNIFVCWYKSLKVIYSKNKLFWQRKWSNSCNQVDVLTISTTLFQS